MVQRVVTVASIGTIDPANVAGVGRDARVFAEYRLRSACAVAGLSAQGEDGVRSLFAVPQSVLGDQLAAMPEAAAYRIGALASSENVVVVARFLRAHRASWIVVDPVMQATRGGSLYRDPDAALEAIREELASLPALVTPNLQEAAALCGRRVFDLATMEDAGRDLLARGARAVLVKGGHLEGEPIDVLVTAHDAQRFAGIRLEGSMRGRGCTLAASLACELAMGRDPASAVESARKYVRDKIARSKGQVPSGVQSGPFA